MIEKLLAFQKAKVPTETSLDVTVFLEESITLSKCNYCDFETDSNKRLDEHMTAKHTERPAEV